TCAVYIPMDSYIKMYISDIGLEFETCKYDTDIQSAYLYGDDISYPYFRLDINDYINRISGCIYYKADYESSEIKILEIEENSIEKLVYRLSYARDVFSINSNRLKYIIDHLDDNTINISYKNDVFKICKTTSNNSCGLIIRSLSKTNEGITHLSYFDIITLDCTIFDNNTYFILNNVAYFNGERVKDFKFNSIITHTFTESELYKILKMKDTLKKMKDFDLDSYNEYKLNYHTVCNQLCSKLNNDDELFDIMTSGVQYIDSGRMDIKSIIVE
ncbi:MAG: hypothetical protein ACRCXT_19315, partial [Paraclostridium sp.]